MALVLVVDDEPDMLMLLRVNLELEGHDVLLAADGEAGLQVIESEEPDVVLLDAMMPVMDGWAVLAALEAWPAEQRPAVVVVSAKASPPDVQRALDLGATDFIPKPFDTTHLLTLVEQLAALTADERAAHRAAKRAAF